MHFRIVVDDFKMVVDDFKLKLDNTFWPLMYFLARPNTSLKICNDSLQVLLWHCRNRGHDGDSEQKYIIFFNFQNRGVATIVY